MKTPRLQSWLCLVLIAVTTVPSDVSASNVDALASALDKIASRLPQRVRSWSKNVPSEHVSATMDVPSQDIIVSVVDDADGSVKSDDIADCSEDGTCETGSLYDGDEGEKEKEHVSASTVDAEVGHKIVELDDIVDTGDLYNEDEEDDEDEVEGDGDYEEEREEIEDEEGCFDNNEKCDEWASMGECEANPKYMLTYCKKSCMICGDVEIDLGEEQIIDSKLGDQVRERIDAARDYVKNVVAKDPKQRKVLEGCKLNHENCAYWAVLGECEANPVYMKMKCAPVCQTCDQLSIDARCPIDPETMPNAWKPGDLNKFFTNITTLEEYQQFEPKVLSRPSYLADDTEETADYQIGPWVVVLENVLSQEEAERMIELGAVEGYERSSDVGKVHFDGTVESYVNEGRTSTNAWCQNDCYDDETAQRVIERVTNITNIPEENSEYLQLLKYEVGEFYQEHHDYIPHGTERQSGMRMITVYLYLNDVEEGGGTNFPELGLTVQPRRGRALIWPSVLDEAPDEKDDRTEHQALPVIKGVKYGANAWIHERDFKTPLANGCG